MVIDGATNRLFLMLLLSKLGLADGMQKFLKRSKTSMSKGGKKILKILNGTDKISNSHQSRKKNSPRLQNQLPMSIK